MTTGGLYLGLDVGTQGTKGLLLHPEHGVVARGSSSYGLIPGLRRGAAEQHPETWLTAVADVIGQLLADRPAADVRAVGVAGQQHGFVALDADGRVIRPAKLWCDTSTSTEAAELSERLARPVPTGFTASKVLWMKRREPAAFDRLRHVLLPHDYVNFRLTGEFTTEPGDASGTGYFDAVRGEWDEAAVLSIDEGLATMLPSLRPPGGLAGVVTEGAGAEFGLAPGTLVSTGGGDNMMSAIGSGAVTPGVVVLSLGTSGTVFTYAEDPLVDPEGLIAPFCGSAGGHLPLLCVMNLTGVTEEVRAAVGLSHEELTARAATVGAGSGGLLWMPFLVGERVPDLPQASGRLLGMSSGCLEPGRLYRAAIEGTSLNLAWGIDRLRRLGVEIDELRVVGGAAANPVWRQVLAASCEVPVRRLLENEAASLGAALQAMWAAGRHAAPPGESRIAPLVEPFVELADDIVTPGGEVAAYRELRADFARALATHYGVE